MIDVGPVAAATEPELDAETVGLMMSGFTSEVSKDYLELTKPRLTGLVALTALVGFEAAPGSGTALGPLLASLLGTTLLAAGGCALNMVIERDRDALMERTKLRPLPAGRLEPFDATVFGVVLAVTGLFLLMAGTNALTTFLGVVALVSYLALYTPLKKTTAICTLFGAIPGALPPAMGWTAATGRLDPGAYVLFGLLFLWQLPHFLSIAWMRRDDYIRGGFAMLTGVDTDGSAASRQLVLHCLALIPVSLMPTLLGIAGPVYFFTALTLGVVYLAAATRLALVRTHRAAKQLFLTSLIYLPFVLTVLMFDRGAR